MSRIRQSVLAKYLISYSGIVLLCCAAIGFFILNTFVNLRTEAYTKTAKEKMSSVLSDMEVQFESLEDIAIDISTTSEFNFRLFSLNKFYEIELLEVFAKYKNYSPMTNDYFMIYHQYPDLVYKVDDGDDVGNSAVFSHYIKSKLKAEDIEALRDKILDIDSSMLIDLSEYGGKYQQILVCYPIYTSAVKEDSCKASLCFIVDRQLIVNRINTVSGGFGDRFALYYDDFLLTDEEKIPFENDEIISKANDDGLFEFEADINSDSLFQLIKGYQNITITFFIVSLALFLMIAIYIAYSNYKPIRAFVRKYGETPSKFFSDVNEFENIEQYLAKAKMSVETAAEKSVLQMNQLKSQILLLLLGGIVSNDVRKNLEVLRDGFKGPFYKVLCVEIGDISEKHLKELQAEIEGCSNMDTAVYTCTWRKNERIYVILSMKEDDSGYFVNELIKDICEAKEYKCLIGESTSKGGIETIHDSCLQSINALSLSKNEMDNRALDNNADKASKEMQQIIGYINEHYLEWDLSLEKLAELFSINSTCLSSTFKAESGVNYKAYIIGLRIKEAKRLLRETDISVAEICRTVGYSSLSYFIIKFKEIVGQTPNQYRIKMENFKIM